MDCGEELLELRRWRFERRELSGELVHGEGVGVPAGLVVTHRFVEGAGAGERFVEGGGAPFGVLEGVGDALGGDEVLVVSGVPDQRPTWAEGLAKVAGDGG